MGRSALCSKMLPVRAHLFAAALCNCLTSDPFLRVAMVLQISNYYALLRLCGCVSYDDQLAQTFPVLLTNAHTDRWKIGNDSPHLDVVTAWRYVFVPQ